MNNKLQASGKSAATAITEFIILLLLVLWLFRPLFAAVAQVSLRSSEMVHILIAPVAVWALIYCRRQKFADCALQPTAWGILVLAGGIFLYAVTTWPFDYGYARDLAILPVLAGSILIVGGWKVLKLSLPMLLLVLLAIPVGSRLYASLVIRPETITISVTARLLELLPAMQTWVKGTDLFFSRGDFSGIIALAETNRGSRLLLTFAVIGVFVAFSRFRSPWRLAAVAVLAPPIVFLGNFLRFLFWALIQIYTNVHTASAVPRNISAILAIAAVYGLFALVCEFNFNFFVDDQPLQEKDNND